MICWVLFLIYIIAYQNIKNKKSWDIFTRIVSTYNALQCLYMIYYEMFLYGKGGMSNLYYVASDYSTDSLYFFSYYLFIDGLFQLLKFTDILSILHHFIGSFGIYLIANNRMGFFLGYYFAMTEISTPFLNLSWYFRNKILFVIFYILFTISRIFTIPFLLEYLNNNTENILTLNTIQSFMSFYGSYSLITLNSIWFIFLTKKLIF